MNRTARGLDVLFVILDIGLMLENSTVFQSQVGEQLLAIRESGLSAGLVAVYRDRNVFERVIGARLHDADIEIELVRDRGFLRNVLAVALAVRRIRRRTPVTRGYVRGIWGAVALALAHPIRRLPYVYDVRGALSDENAAYGSGAVKRRIYAAIERWALARAERLTAVSHRLARSVSAAHGGREVTVIPCCITLRDAATPASEAAAARRALGFAPEHVVLVYSGGLSPYQQIPAMLRLWRRLGSEPDVRFLLLTNDDPQKMPEFVGDVRDFGPALKRLSLPRNDVLRALAAADVGFMLRDSRELNRSASPVKFAEYVGAGLVVVASPATGDISDLIQSAGIGALVDPDHLEEGERRTRQLIARVRQERAALRERAMSVARSRYDWVVYLDVFRALYGDGANAGAMPRSS